MKIRVLGCGTSTGVPVPGCRCAVCCSEDPKNKRLRTSIFIELEEKDRPGGPREGLNTESKLGNVLVDTGPDLRYQLLREDITEVDFVLYTHTHADHIFGIDDLRGICYTQQRTINGFASVSSVQELRRVFPYIFSPDPAYLGGAPPDVQLTHVDSYVPFPIADVPALPLPVFHGTLEILGFRIGRFAYLTDCSSIPERTQQELSGLDVLLLSGLRERPHPTHFTLEQAREQVAKVSPKKAYLIHLSHDVEYQKENEKLLAESGGRVELAYDGLRIQL